MKQLNDQLKERKEKYKTNLNDYNIKNRQY